jgi:hypothetical protein
MLEKLEDWGLECREALAAAVLMRLCLLFIQAGPGLVDRPFWKIFEAHVDACSLSFDLLGR